MSHLRIQNAHLGLGHRRKMVKKLFQDASETLLDYELLEVLLYSVIKRKDVRRTTKELLKHCGGSLSKVLRAEPEYLKQVDGIGDATVATIICTRRILDHVLSEQIASGSILKNRQNLIDYLKTTIGHNTIESLRVIYLNKRYCIIKNAISGWGTVDRVAIYNREIIKTAMNIGASAIIISHNHPGGDPKPSKADLQKTAQLKHLCENVNIELLDHVIISGSDYYSFQDHSLLL